jgi:hypothetical protein
MPDPNQVSASKLKITTLLRADEFLAIQARDGQPRVVLKVKLPDRVLTADVAAKSVLKAQVAIKESGSDGVALVLQGVLVGDAIVKAGLSAQPKSPKPAGNSDRDKDAQTANA